ncbi:helix-turn-helix domain-containing protein [Streptomyces sp. SLBN-118]|uniref:helix-turn-helix domain-containing protein n=1 Tax=Streptomyces sp. SLBN-118 TaxID=2768454 RepID=UPI0037DA371A
MTPSRPAHVWRSRAGRPRARPRTTCASTGNRSPAIADAEPRRAAPGGIHEKATVWTIAAELGRSPSTVSRQMRRNRHPRSGICRPHAPRHGPRPAARGPGSQGSNWLVN